jgi:hypothetical protein
MWPRANRSGARVSHRGSSNPRRREDHSVIRVGNISRTPSAGTEPHWMLGVGILVRWAGSLLTPRAGPSPNSANRKAMAFVVAWDLVHFVVPYRMPRLPAKFY